MKVDFNLPSPKDARHLPIGATLIGRVSEDDDSSPGALIRLGSGVYARMNEGHRGALDQALVIDAIERAKNGTGDALAIDQATKQCTMMLTPTVINILRNYGAGNLTEGVRRAAALVTLCGSTS